VKKTIRKIKQKGSVRIIGGHYRGKVLSFPATEGLRPTADRIRETVFNWLMHDIRGARCLDAFAGSGALGFEAYSRGAAHVMFIEPEPDVYRNLKHIITSFATPTLQVINTTAADYLRQQSHQSQVQYDIIFVDPPFAQPQLLDCISFFEQSSLLVDQGLLYLESPQEVLLDPVRWEKLKLKKAGQVTYALYRKKETFIAPA
jgi:16S rRNA (guanine966-N2)-methyltransferase